MAFLSEKLSMVNTEMQGQWQEESQEKSYRVYCFSVFFMAPLKITFFNLLYTCHQQRFERTSASFDLQLLFWKLHCCLLFSSGCF